MKRLGWTILDHDVRRAGVQVDLVARDPDGVRAIIEVKKESALVHLSNRQKARLFRVAQCLAETEPVRFYFVIVGSKRIEVLPVDALTG